MRYKLGLKKEVAEKISYDDFCKMFSFAFDCERAQDRDDLRKSEFKRITKRKWDEGTAKKDKFPKKVGDKFGSEDTESSPEE